MQEFEEEMCAEVLGFIIQNGSMLKNITNNGGKPFLFIGCNDENMVTKLVNSDPRIMFADFINRPGNKGVKNEIYDLYENYDITKEILGIITYEGNKYKLPGNLLIRVFEYGLA